jgi:hypothetical protein
MDGGRVPSAEWREWVQPIVRVVALGVAALMVAACSSDGSAAPTTSPAAATVTTGASETSPATAAPTTPATSTTTVATTTLPATTTTVATDELVKQAVQDYQAAYWTCGQAPTSCDPTAFTASQGESRTTIEELAGGLMREGLYFSSDLRGSYLVPETIDVNSSSEVVARSCWYDAAVVLGPIGPDGQPTVVNDEIISIRYDLTLFLEDGVWRVGGQVEDQRLGEGNLCPPAA